MPVPFQHVVRAEYPNGTVVERVEEKYLLIRHGDWVFDWGVYDWAERWSYDSRHMLAEDKTQWFYGRYLVEAERLERDMMEDGSMPQAAWITPHREATRPSWFREPPKI